MRWCDLNLGDFKRVECWNSHFIRPPFKSGLLWLRELLHPMDSLERMYSPSIAMYPSKCVCIHASVPQWYDVNMPID